MPWAASIATVMQLRVRRSSPGRDQTAPHAYRVRCSWKSLVNAFASAHRAIDVRVAEHLAAGRHSLLSKVVRHQFSPRCFGEVLEHQAADHVGLLDVDQMRGVRHHGDGRRRGTTRRRAPPPTAARPDHQPRRSTASAHRSGVSGRADRRLRLRRSSLHIPLRTAGQLSRVTMHRRRITFDERWREPARHDVSRRSARARRRAPRARDRCTGSRAPAARAHTSR